MGLLIVFGGVGALVSPIGRCLGEDDRVATHVRGHVVLWLLFAAILAVVLLWEREPLASLWLRPLRWRSLLLGIASAAVHIYVVFPFNMWFLNKSGLSGFGAGMNRVLSLPMWLRIVAVITAAVVEETLFHGYALTRLGTLLGSYWGAAVIVVLAFAFLHYPMWGSGPVQTFVVAGAVSAVVFILTRDLFAMILAHALVDTMGLIVTPLRLEWWNATEAAAKIGARRGLGGPLSPSSPRPLMASGQGADGILAGAIPSPACARWP